MKEGKPMPEDLTPTEADRIKADAPEVEPDDADAIEPTTGALLIDVDGDDK